MKAQEWKDKTRKKFELKSGLEVVIRRLSPFALAKIGAIPGLESNEDVTPEFAEELLKLALISPTIGEGPDDISLLDLSGEDTNEIMEAIIGKLTGGEKDGVPLDSTASAGTPQS
jgi:hypothetical protein